MEDPEASTVQALQTPADCLSDAEPSSNSSWSSDPQQEYLSRRECYGGDTGTLHAPTVEEPTALLVGEESDLATAVPAQPSYCTHPPTNGQDAARTIREEIIGVLEKARARISQLETTVGLAPSSAPSRIAVAASRTPNRSASHNGATSHSFVHRGDSLKHQKLTDLKARLEKLSSEFDVVIADDSPAGMRKLEALKKSALFHLLPRSNPTKVCPTISCNSSVSSVFSTSKKSSVSVGNWTSSSRIPTYGRSVSYGDRPSSASSTKSKSNILPRSGYICSITSGLEKEGFISCTPGKETKVRLILWSKDVRSRPPSGSDCLQARLEATSIDTEGATVPNIAVRQLRADSFELSFTLLETAVSWRLHVTLLGSPINGSPFLVLAKKPTIREDAVRESLFAPVCSKLSGSFKNRTPSSPKSRSTRTVFSAPVQMNSNRLSEVEEDDLLMHSIGSFGRTNGHFLNPQGICVTDDDQIAVTDSQLGIVQVFNAAGDFVKRIGQRGRKPGQLLRPTGITFAPHCMNQWDMDIFVVADYENRTIVVFNMDGIVLANFGASVLTGPKGVAVTTSGDILVIDNRSNSLVIFRNGKFFKKAWTPSSSQANLAGPHYVTVSRASGEIFVSDFHHHSIKVFDHQYNYRWSFGSFSADGGMGSFSGPTGIAVDHRGLVVADWGSGRVQLFDHSGSFLAFVTYSRPLYGPQGLALGLDGSIYVCDPGNHCVRVFRHPLDGAAPASVSTSSKDEDSESQISS